MNSIASVLGSQGKYDEAEELHRQTLKMRQKVLRNEYPHTLINEDGTDEYYEPSPPITTVLEWFICSFLVLYFFLLICQGGDIFQIKVSIPLCEERVGRFGSRANFKDWYNQEGHGGEQNWRHFKFISHIVLRSENVSWSSSVEAWKKGYVISIPRVPSFLSSESREDLWEDKVVEADKKSK